jgi:putative inorganic carbon (hco3(-)) transporter
MRITINPKKRITCLFFFFSSLVFIFPFISEAAYPVLGIYIGIVISLIFLLLLLHIKTFQISTNIFIKPLLLYILLVLISCFYSINLRSSLYAIYQLIPLLCLFFFTSNLKNKESVRLIHIILISASILSVYGIYQYFWGFEHTKAYINLHLKEILETRYAREILLTRRAIASFFSPNMFGCYLAMVIPLCACRLLDRINKRKPFFFLVFSLIVMLIALLLTKSLAAWTSLFFGAILFFILARRFINRITLISCIFIILMPLFIIFLRSDMFINISNQQNTIAQRLNFWKSSVGIINDFPVKGVGIGNFGNIYPKYKELIANETRFSHNILLQTWAETGLLGLFSIIFLSITFIRRSIVMKKDFFNIGLICSCYIFLINNLFDFSYFIPQVSFIWWINMGIFSRECAPLNNKSDSKTVKYVIAAIILIMIYLNIRTLIALNYFQKGDFKKAITLEPYNDLYYAAIHDYSKAVLLNPYSPFYHKDFALFYLKNNMIKESISEFEKASYLYPSNQHIHQQLFELYKKTGQTEKAEEELNRMKEFKLKYSGYFIR